MNRFLSQSIPCPHFSICSGCLYSKNVDKPPLYEDMQKFFTERTLDFHYYYDEPTAWRIRAKLAVRGDVKNPLIGLYKLGTHEVEDIPDCLVHHPKINEAAQLIKKWMVSQKLHPYNEYTHQGLLKYLQCTVEEKTDKVQLVLVISQSQPLSLESLYQMAPDFWHSIWINVNDKKTNTIFGDSWNLLMGEEFLKMDVENKQICFHPANFIQANVKVFKSLILDLKNAITPSKNVVEYYAGVGVIGFALADGQKKVICSEINPFAKYSFEESLKKTTLKNLTFVEGHASQTTELLKEAEIVIVDPPRKGLDKELVETLLNYNHLEELWYISCGFEGFKKDYELLKEKWKMVSAKGYLFFPGTNQIELLVCFKPNN